MDEGDVVTFDEVGNLVKYSNGELRRQLLAKLEIEEYNAEQARKRDRIAHMTGGIGATWSCFDYDSSRRRIDGLKALLEKC